MGGKIYLDLEEWYERYLKHRPGKLANYSRNIRTSIEELGEENVGVFLFEGLQEDPAAYHSAICRFMGIDAAEGVRLTEHEHRNPRIAEHQLDRIRVIDRSFWKRRRFDRKTITEREIDLGGAHLSNVSDPVPVEAEIPRRISAAVSEATREGNRWLVERLGLPLEEYGYPL